MELAVDNAIELLTNKYGRQFYVFARDTFFRVRATVGPYQLTNLRYLRKICPNPHTIIDGGAHIGSNTVEYATWAKHVLSFEPDLENFAVLQKNVALALTQPTSDFKKSWFTDSTGTCSSMTATATVELFNKAVGESNKQIAITKVPNNYGHNRVIKSVETSKYSQQPVEMVRLDDVVDCDKYKVDIIKLDIEGYELFALNGAQNILDTHRPIIQCETLPQMAKVFGSTIQALCNYLQDRDYKMYLNTGEEVPINNWFPVKRRIDRFYIPSEKSPNKPKGMVF